jgi:hypothetical protein
MAELSLTQAIIQAMNFLDDAHHTTRQSTRQTHLIVKYLNGCHKYQKSLI